MSRYVLRIIAQGWHTKLCTPFSKASFALHLAKQALHSIATYPLPVRHRFLRVTLVRFATRCRYDIASYASRLSGSPPVVGTTLLPTRHACQVRHLPVVGTTLLPTRHACQVRHPLSERHCFLRVTLVRFATRCRYDSVTLVRFGTYPLSVRQRHACQVRHPLSGRHRFRGVTLVSLLALYANKLLIPLKTNQSVSQPAYQKANRDHLLKWTSFYL